MTTTTILEQHGATDRQVDMIDLKRITVDPATQLRVATDPSTVEEYAEQYRRHGASHLPPIVLIEVRDAKAADHGTLYLADGHHRVGAARDARLKQLPALIRKGTKRDAILYAVGANAQHGLRLTVKDKHRIVATLLGDEEWRQWSDREIARHCHVSATFVGQVRRTVRDAQITKRKSRDGVMRETANIGTKSRDQAVDQVDDQVIDEPGQQTLDGAADHDLAPITAEEESTLAADEHAEHMRETAATTAGAAGADGSQWNEHGCCVSGELLSLPTPKSSGMTLSLRVAQTPEGTWRYGMDYQHKHGGGGRAPSRAGTAYPDRGGAVWAGVQEAWKFAKQHGLNAKQLEAIMQAGRHLAGVLSPTQRDDLLAERINDALADRLAAGTGYCGTIDDLLMLAVIVGVESSTVTWGTALRADVRHRFESAVLTEVARCVRDGQMVHQLPDLDTIAGLIGVDLDEIERLADAALPSATGEA